MRIVMGIVAALLFGYAGLEMITLESQAGNTVAEAFYNAVGILSFGLAALSITVAMPVPAATLAKEQGAGLSRPTSSADGKTVPSPVAGWDPLADRRCPFCGREVAKDRRTHCNHCGEPLVVRRSSAD